ncbi:MAG: LapA family protein [Syntrophorhabdaceae bacterium]|nr:LapA family protein [Syntrophorhabdaceae bacterium]
MAIIIVACIIILCVAMFSVQNAAPVAISFLFWRFDASLAIVIFLSALAGAVITFTIMFWLRIRRQAKKKQTNKGNGSQGGSTTP